MSGGDLDGDVYMVIWNKLIVGGLKRTHKPAVYKKFNEDPKLIVDSKDIEDHMADYFQKDNLGKLSNLHLALCDKFGSAGPFTKEAQELSWYISIAVDFAKHGKCIEHRLYKDIEALVTEYPDYMEKSESEHKKTIESPHILG